VKATCLGARQPRPSGSLRNTSTWWMTFCKCCARIPSQIRHWNHNARNRKKKNIAYPERAKGCPVRQLLHLGGLTAVHTEQGGLRIYILCSSTFSGIMPLECREADLSQGADHPKLGGLKGWRLRADLPRTAIKPRTQLRFVGGGRHFLRHAEHRVSPTI
jgi:hypothetical protein